MVGWEFKRARFVHHGATLGLLGLEYVGVGSPSDLASAEDGERKTLALFEGSPFGMSDALAGKRVQRDPFQRRHPYKLPWIEMMIY